MPGAPTIVMIGFGYVANHTAARLAAAGWAVRATTRSAQTAQAIGVSGYDARVADPATADGARALDAALESADAVLSSAPPQEDGDPVMPALSHASLAGKRLIYLSTTGIYGDRGGGWAFEAEPPTPGQDRSIRRTRAEAKWLDHGAVSLRLGGIYGPGRSAFDRLDAGAPVHDKPGQVFSRIHVADIAAAVEACLTRPRVSGPLNLVDDRPCGQAELMTGAARLAGAPPPEIRPFDPAEASTMRASFFAENRRVSNALAKSVLGWRPAYPTWREGLAAIQAQSR